ncbi:hypothetical protein [Nonomuraea sp. NPDC050643]|uniref:hypothetical protein n=1 Tax=Nonomuraea sp. NPDC050643 TaxID=3155660 RepID=UPI0033C6B072
MADEWKPIKLYEYLGDTKPGFLTTRAQVVAYLKNTDPDRIESAGNSYVKAAELVHGKNGLEGTLMKAAEELAEVWRGDGATEALKALRLLHASAAALGDAMEKTGKPMAEYGRQLRTYRSTMPSSTFAGATTDVENEPEQLLPAQNSMGYLVDNAARAHLEKLNNKITELNAQMAAGLAFQLPEIKPLTVDTQQAPKLDPGSGTDTPTGQTQYWNGGGSDGTGGSSGSSGGGGSDGGGNSGGKDDTGDTGGSDGDTTQPDRPEGQDPGQNDPGQDDPGQDDPGQDDPGQGDPTTPDRPGAETPQDQPEGQDQSVPPVIGADTPRTELADAGPTTTTPPTTTTTPTANPYGPTPTVLTPTGQFPPGTTNPYGIGPGTPGGGSWYGPGGATPSTSPAVLRGGAGTPGAGFMGYPPMMGAGAGGEQGDERSREIYDPEGDVWSSPHQTSPDRIG